MGFLNRLLGREEAQAREAEAPEPVCPHAALIPHWDSAEDIGKADRVSSYTCESCKASFSREDGTRIVAEAVERVRIAEEQRL